MGFAVGSPCNSKYVTQGECRFLCKMRKPLWGLCRMEVKQPCVSGTPVVPGPVKLSSAMKRNALPSCYFASDSQNWCWFSDFELQIQNRVLSELNT